MPLTLALASCAGLGDATAQQSADPCAELPAVHAEIGFRLSLEGPAVFREGEIIPLRLELTSAAAGKYYGSTRSYDRSGRLGLEAFCLEPDDARDPLADYFGAQLFGFIGGGLSPGPQLLGREPLVSIRELNEWRAVPPGRHRARVRTHVERAAAADEPGRGVVPVSVWSNAVEFEVVPATAEWQADQLAVAVRDLDSGDPERAQAGVRRLRFLGSEASTREMVRRFTGGPDAPGTWELRFGIVGSPHREVALAELRAALVEPQRAATKEQAELLALLEVQSQPEHQLPPYDPTQDREAWGQRYKAKLAAYQERLRRHLAAAGSVERRADARAGSLGLLLDSLDEAPSLAARARQQVIESWPALSGWQQLELMEQRWDAIAGPELVPLLRAIVDGEVPLQPGPLAADSALVWHRLFELSPAEGRERLLREIRAPGRRDIGIEILELLGDEDAPEIERLALSRLEAGSLDERDALLVERYASARALPRLKAIYAVHASRRFPCDAQAALLRSFLRLEPDHGAAVLQAALAQRGQTGCFQWLLQGVDGAVALPQVEPLAIQSLDDPHPDLAASAAAALMEHGTARAEGALWRRMQRFHAEWKDRAAQLRPSPGQDERLQRQAALEQALATAIAKGRSWYCGSERLAQLRALVSPGLRDEVDAWLAEQRAGLVVSVHWWRGRLEFRAGGVRGTGLPALEQRLGQLPRGGLTLLVHATPATRARHGAEIEAIEAAVKASGFELLRPDAGTP